MQRYDFSIDAGVTSRTNDKGITIKQHNVIKGRVVIEDRRILIELDDKDPVVVAVLEGTELVFWPELAREIAPVPKPPELTAAEEQAEAKNEAEAEEPERKRKR